MGGFYISSGDAFTSLMVCRWFFHIWWGAYLGMDMQCLIEGPLDDVDHQIIERRNDLRLENGWIMDIYLMKKFRN